MVDGEGEGEEMSESDKNGYAPLTHFEIFNCYLLLPEDAVTNDVNEVDCFKCRKRLNEIITERQSAEIIDNYSQSR